MAEKRKEVLGKGGLGGALLTDLSKEEGFNESVYYIPI